MPIGVELSGDSHYGVKVWVTGLLNPRSIGAYCHDLASQAHHVHSVGGVPDGRLAGWTRDEATGASEAR
ncbi:unnamed protein product [Clonostachys rhizophaga]|uniref:Uncharacterized protein n=1 Tax=Clonostachys rhizophaga TaxID=160324 RepID=A0A9N9YIH1_9HYPO|nr:unnamed protein product [Clonostachys rhizophaga]